jgi:3-dehydroquinate synthase
MEDLLVHNFFIKSHSRTYSVEFNNDLIGSDELNTLGTHYIIDKNVLGVLGGKFYQNIMDKTVVVIEATEETKSYSGLEPVIDALIQNKLNRDSHLVAIGGGITQDITCFIANTFMRGISWTFVPTTLLAQADSCIGSKSSINFGKYKNILGSFTPPNRVIICEKFLSTLTEKDIRSGIGEIIKLYLIDGKLVDSETIRNDLSLHLYNTLKIKKTFIEEDEFDKGIRNLLNYGHCFGHAIESATNFGIPHGIAISMGMDIANKLSMKKDLLTEEIYKDMHNILFSNYKDYISIPVNVELLLTALGKDKKNTGNKLNVILPVHDHLEKFGFDNSNETLKLFKSVFDQLSINFVD